MTGEAWSGGGRDFGSVGDRRAVIRTAHADPAVVADAVSPDHTDEMTTAVAASREGASWVVTRIERGTTGGLHATVDDYVVNLVVAEAVSTSPSTTRQPAGGDGQTASRGDESAEPDTSIDGSLRRSTNDTKEHDIHE